MRARCVLALVALAAAGCGGARPRPAAPRRLDAHRDVARPRRRRLPHPRARASRCATAPTSPARRARAATLATLAVLTDVHVRDEESPARVPFLDRLGGAFSSTFRPQEALSAAGPRRRGALGERRAPRRRARHRRPDRQRAGQRARPGAHGPRRRPRAARLGRARLRRASRTPPTPTPPTTAPTSTRRATPACSTPRSGRSARPACAHPGTRCPATTTCCVAGELARTPSTAAVAVGGERLVQPDAGPRRAAQRGRADAAARRPRAQRRAARAHTPRSRPTPARRELTPDEAIAGLRAASGHGGSGARMDYAFDAGRAVRVIVLDTVRRDVGSGGVLAPEQVRWLRRPAAPPPATRRVVVVSHQPLTKVAGRAAALALLDADPHVVARAGRRLAPQPHRRARTRAAGGYWLVQTAALADYPQQARVLRVREAAGRRHRDRDVDARHRARPAGRHRARARLPRRAGRAPAARGGHAPGPQRPALPALTRRAVSGDAPLLC